MKYIVLWKNETIEELSRAVESIKCQSNNQIEIVELINHDTKVFVDASVKKHKSVEGEMLTIIEDIVTEAKEENCFLFIRACDEVCFGVDFASRKIEKNDVVVTNMYYRENMGRPYLVNLSAGNRMNTGDVKELLLDRYLADKGEDRFLFDIYNKIISKNLLMEIITEIKEYSDWDWYSVQRAINYLAVSHATKIEYTKDEAIIVSTSHDSDGLEEELDHRIKNFYALTQLINKDGLLTEKQLFKKCDYFATSILWSIDITKYENVLNSISSTFGRKIEPKDFKLISWYKTELEDSSFYYLESIKKFIASDNCKYVGFDIFDTLIQRPFWEPIDLFQLLNDKFNELVGKGTVIDFALLRHNGEMACREYYSAIRPSNEDVTITEIYDFIAKQYGFDKKITDSLKEYEIQLEKRYCSPRYIGKYLYELATYYSKKIVIVSDMYLEQKTIEEILAKSGYDSYTKLYLSNSFGISKYSGNLFRYVLEDQKITTPSSMCFIGDNYGVDCENSSKYGIIPFHVPKAVDIFRGLNKAIYAGEFFNNIYEPNGGIIHQNTVLKFLGIRCMLAVVANKMFGNPFVSFNKNSDFNLNPSFIGYYCCGMFLFSEAKWLIDESLRKEIGTLHFIARDGFYVKEAYDLIKKVVGYGADSNYLYLSRKVAAPLYLMEPEGIFELFLPPHILNQTPKKIINLLSPVIDEDIDIKDILKKNGIPFEKKFDTLNEFYVFSRVFRENLYSPKRAEEYTDLLREYYGNICHDKDAIFDVGYSGRLELALKKLLGFTINSFYLHEHEPWALNRKRCGNFSIDSFYGFKPCSAFVLREQIFTPAQPSCLGIIRDETNTIKPRFAIYKQKDEERLLLGEIQASAIEFVKDICNIYGEDIGQLVFNRFDACIPFEYVMHYTKRFDRCMFEMVDFEDEFGLNTTMSLADYWDEERNNYKLNSFYESKKHQENTLVDNNNDVEIMRKLEDSEYHLREIRNSFSYKLGLALTAVPRRLRARTNEKH